MSSPQGWSIPANDPAWRAGKGRYGMRSTRVLEASVLFSIPAFLQRFLGSGHAGLRSQRRGGRGRYCVRLMPLIFSPLCRGLALSIVLF